MAFIGVTRGSVWSFLRGSLPNLLRESNPYGRVFLLCACGLRGGRFLVGLFRGWGFLKGLVLLKIEDRCAPLGIFFYLRAFLVKTGVFFVGFDAWSLLDWVFLGVSSLALFYAVICQLLVLKLKQCKRTCFTWTCSAAACFLFLVLVVFFCLPPTEVYPGRDLAMKFPMGISLGGPFGEGDYG